jgi:trans-aconitate methyltransferase
MTKLYGDLASWWPLLSSPGEYEEEAAFYAAALVNACDTPPRTVLELGSGGGNNASHLKLEFECTLTDLSAEMLDVSRRLNPECEHVLGDMRTLRLGRTFDVVLVHDAVRPFITRVLIDTVVAAALAHGAAICALPIAETVKRVHDDVVEATLERAGLWTVQTPQGFHPALLREAHEKAQRDGVVGTDDAMLVERLGHPVRVVPGVAGNVKITTVEDLRRARGRS